MGEGKKFLMPHVFNAVKEMNQHSERLYQKAEETNNPEMKVLYEEIVGILDETSDKILEIGKYDNHTVQTTAVNLVSKEGLPAYTQLTILHEYQNGHVLTEDTAGNLYFLKDNEIRYEY